MSRENDPLQSAVRNGSRQLEVPALRSRFRGKVIAPGDADYDAARVTFYGGIDHRPAAIVRAADAGDVIGAIALARETGLPLSIRSGGHSISGFSVADGGIMLDLRDMRALHFDLPSRTAWAEAGLTAGEYTSAAAAYGLATPFGDTGSVGLGGLTLGGGVGYLVRKHGLTIDSLLAADVVTADGQLLRVDAEHYPDLFWAIRGGGGNFGVATRFQYRLHPLEEVTGGMLILPASPEVIAGFMAAAEAAPDELSTIANIMFAPPMPFLPPAAHGQLILMAMMAYAGPDPDAQRALAPFRALAEPIADMLHPMKYTEMFPPEEVGYRPTTVSRTMLLERVDRAAAEAIIENLRASEADFRVTQLRVLGGAMGRVPVDATAFAHRKARVMANLAAFYTDEDERVRRDAWVQRFAGTLDQGNSGVYVNFLEGGTNRLRDAYPGAALERLAKVKARYDPQNLFHLNHNIQPAAV